MNVSLIYPLVLMKNNEIKNDRLRFSPLGIAYLAAALIERGHRVNLWDRDVISEKSNYRLLEIDRRTIDDLKKFKPDVIGFSATTPLMCDVKHFSDIVRKTMPDTRIIIGGPHPTVEPEESLKACPAVDIVVRGEGERSVVDLVDNLDNLSAVKGITFRSGENIISNNDAEQIEDLDTIPMPRRDLLYTDFYSKPIQARGLYGRFATTFASRGCNSRCNFCAGYKVFRGGIRSHSVNRIVLEIEDIILRHKIDYLYFCEDDFFFSKKRAYEFCDLLIKKGINKRVKWIAQVRAHKDTADRGLLRIAKKAGCIQLEIGFESGSQEELDRMNKRAKVENYYSILQLIKKAGIRCQANLILKYPDQTADDFRKTISFIKSSNPTVVQPNNYWPLPGSRAYLDLKRKGYDMPWDGSAFENSNFSSMNDKEYMEIFKSSFWPLCNKINNRSYYIFLLFNKPSMLFPIFFGFLRDKLKDIPYLRTLYHFCQSLFRKSRIYIKQIRQRCF